MAPESRLGHVGIIGGGISGLALAHFLQRAGARVTVLEASSQLGGLGTWFSYDGRQLERFYHCILPTDRDLLGLLSEIGLANDVYWKNTSFGYMRGGQLYPLNGAMDLLRFSPLSIVDRCRVGATGLWGTLCSSHGLDDVSCERWLTGLSGARAFETFWKPMLQAKFGESYREVPALWFWTRFNREKGAKAERKGYVRGGYRRIAEALANQLRSKGVSIQLNTPVKRIGLDSHGMPLVDVSQASPLPFDRLVYAGPITHLRRLVCAGEWGCPAAQLGADIDMQGVLNTVMLLKRGFSRHYWVATVDEAVPFQGIVESTTLIDKCETGGADMIYLTKYVHRSDPLFANDDAAILASHVFGLRKLFSDFDERQIIQAFVFRSPFVEPIYTLGYQRKQPPRCLVANRLFLATTAQVYPQVTSWNGSTRLARQVADDMIVQARQ
jgi:protoporphyrinogen oxidase